VRDCGIASTVNVKVVSFSLDIGLADKLMTRVHGRVKALLSAGTLSTWNEVNSAEPDPKLVGTEIRYGT
jgi:hypothetical protein